MGEEEKGKMAVDDGRNNNKSGRAVTAARTGGFLRQILASRGSSQGT
jgi:hypothetical protein